MKFLPLLVAAFGLSGCAVSLQPFYSPETIVDNRSIEGRWTDGETTWVVTRKAPGRFEIATCDEDGCQADTVAVLFRTAGATFLDYREKSPGHFMPSIRPHGLFEVRLRQGEVDLSPLEGDRLAKLAERRLLDTEFAELESGTLLTASPESLQRFIVRHLADGQVFGESHHLWRAAVGE